MILSRAASSKVQVLPDEAFGLIHGKAGVITRTDGSQVCFIGCANESRTAWVCNYELVWLDESEEGVRWVQEEFDALNILPSEYWASPEAFHKLRKPDLQRVKRLSRDFFPKHNPFIRRIVRRTRDYLENTIDPHTNEPYLQRIEVRLFGESEAEAIGLPPFLRGAYDATEEFCAILARRPGLNSGFMKTILLRRVGSTIEAGRLTAQQMLNTDAGGSEEEWEDDAQESPASIYPEAATQTHFPKMLTSINNIVHQQAISVSRVLVARDGGCSARIIRLPF